MTKLILPFPLRLFRSPRQLFAFLVAVVFSPVIVFFTMDSAKVFMRDITMANRLQNRMEKDVEKIRGSGCTMPYLDPYFDEKENRNLPTLTCKGTDWVQCVKSKCYVKKEILKSMTDVACTYRDITLDKDDGKLYFGVPFKVTGDKPYTLRMRDHVKVNCTGIPKNSLGLVPTNWLGYKAGFRPVVTKQIPLDYQDSYNVMILCFDSISRNGFIRKMPNSYKYLREELKAVILNSYNIVGDGTMGTLYPILTGMTEEEVNPKSHEAGRHDKYIENIKLIFHLMKDYGYRTAFFEDMSWLGTPHSWFHRQPADHYLRALLMAGISQEKCTKGVPVRHCIGSTPQYQLLMELALEFLQLDGKKFCFTLIGDSSYDNFTVIPTVDETLLSILQNLAKSKTLEDTLVLIMGDHGDRYSSLRKTYRGKMEERLPLMAILVPEKLKKLRPRAYMSLTENTNVLTTPFDIHTTILDALDMRNESNIFNVPGSDMFRAMSLLNRIPKSRSCGEAGVMAHWCACNQWSNISRSNPIFGQVANILAEYIDTIASEQRMKCARRKLRSIEWVIHQSAHVELSKARYYNIREIDLFLKHSYKSGETVPEEYYQAQIIMSPGKSVFEGTMVYNTVGDFYIITQREISRVNAYGDESHCISATHPHLNKYCYCKDQLRARSRNRTFNVFL